jgi:uncharacterized coiled-coil protein SlyX
MFLANLPSPDPASFWQWLLSAAAVLTIVWMGLRVWREFSPRPNSFGPQPFVVSAEKRFALQEELDRVAAEFRVEMNALEQQIKEIDKRIGRSQTEIIAAGESRAKDIHKRIDNFSEHTSDQLNLVTSRLGEVMGQIKQMNLKP